MALPDLTRRLVEEKLGEYCKRRIPAHLLDRVRVGFKIRGNSVTLFEERPAFGFPGKWVDIVVAQLRFNPKRNEWTLYCADRNSRWHEYFDTVPTRDLDDLIREVDEDPTGIFWG